MKWPLSSRVLELFGIDLPIIQSGMAGIAGPDLAAAVSNAGGLGIVAGHTVPVDQLRASIQATRELTSKPFGVNLLVPDDLADSAEGVKLSDSLRGAVDSLRADLDLDECPPELPEPPRDLQDKIDLVCEMRVPVLSFGLGSPSAEQVERFRSSGIKTLAMVTTVADARAVEAAGIDAIVAQGWEAGGHRSHFSKPATPQAGAVGTMALVPTVADAVRIPVLAAGGIADGRGLAAALALGAEGVMLGTRFVACRESLAVTAYKEAILRADSGDTTVTDCFSGRYARVIENELLKRVEKSGATLPFMWQGAALSEVLDRARALDDSRFLALWAGQSCGLIRDLPSAAELVNGIAGQALALLDSLSGHH